MIDTSTWKEFMVGDLFRIEPAKGKNQQELIEGDDVPYIAASKENNGFNRMVSVEGHEDWVSKGNCLQFVHIGDAAAGHVNYIPSDFIGMSGKSSCAYNDRLNEYNGLFIASIIVHTNNGKYSFKDSWTGLKVSNTIIKLPATSDGQPDWDYMESYMKAVMEESEKSLENLKKADDTKHLIDVSGWGEFKLSELVDEYYIAKSLDYGHLQEGDTVFINRSQINNGIQGYVKADAYEKPNCITIGMIGNSKHAFWQTVWFVASQNILVLRNSVWNYYSASFICSIINSLLSDFQDYKDIIKKDDWMQNTKIKLPITSTGEPDWQYMEDYMRRIMDKSEQIISDSQIGA